MNLLFPILFALSVKAGKIVKVLPSDIHKIKQNEPKQRYDCGTDAVIEACDMGDPELLLFTTKLNFEQARCVCAEEGLDLAHLPEFHLMKAGELAWTCLGQFSQAWIASTAIDTRDCLALSIGSETPISPPVLWLPCEGKNAFICRKQNPSK